MEAVGARVVSVPPSVDGPCRVYEQGWWHYRGISPEVDHPSRDLLKVHLRAGDVVRAARDSMIGGHVTWGWGSQYIMVLSDVVERDGWVEVEAMVDRVTPFLFAPRLRIKDVPAEVTLDGKAWHYADGDTVFLPNRPGRYRLRWHYGTPSGPRLCRTMAVVEGTSVEDGKLVLETSRPAWSPDDPGHHGWYALVDDGETRRVHPIEIGRTRIGTG